MMTFACFVGGGRCFHIAFVLEARSLVYRDTEVMVFRKVSDNFINGCPSTHLMGLLLEWLKLSVVLNERWRLSGRRNLEILCIFSQFLQ